ncbi:MAG: O-antigen ligase family protein [Pseudolabrys sp.]
MNNRVVKQPATMMERFFVSCFHRVRHGEAADWLVVAIAVSLPWSTSLTAILIVLWFIAVVPSLDIASVRREILSLAGGLPLLLWALAVVGMLWADVDWSERFGGLRGYHKLLLIPLLLAQFRRSERARWAIFGFLISALALLVLSWLTSHPGFLGNPKADVGVPVKDYIVQSGIFAICAFGLLGQAMEWRVRRPQLALAAVVVAAFFIANIIYVATSRSTLIIIVVLLLILGFRQFGWKGILVVGIIGAGLANLFWLSSPQLRDRVTHVVEEVKNYPTSTAITSTGLRLEFWKKSIEFFIAAPVVGHGTGTIATQFRRSASGHTGVAAAVTGNPHNQILAVAIQLGFIGTLTLIAMWIAHLALFREGTLVGWYGLTVVVSNIVGSLFNSHLFDFSQGWFYVFGVGVLGGVMLRRKHEWA